MTWLNKITDWWIGGPDRRSWIRSRPELVAYYWNGDRPMPHPVRDVSATGLFIECEHEWGIGTSLQLELQETSGQHRRASTLAMVVRHEPGGMGMTFIAPQEDLSAILRPILLNRKHAEAGTSLVEFALILPLLFLLLVNAVNFGGFFYAWITVANAARSGGQYGSLAGATVNSPKATTETQIYNSLTQDISSLRNRSSLAVRFCTQNGVSSGTPTAVCTQTGSGTFPANPSADSSDETTSYVMSWVDVTYTYQPFIPLYSFSKIGFNATLPPTTIHRRAVMRRLQ